MSSPALFTTLPYELLAYVFLLVSSRDRPGSNPLNLRDYQELLRTVTTISSVCSVWRQVAIGTADLWTQIVIGHTFEGRSKMTQERTMTFLQRSKNAPLDLLIRRLGDRRVWAVLWSAVVPHLERCRTLSILVLHGSETTSLWTAMQRSSFTILEHFSLLDFRPRLLDDSSAAPEDLLGQQPLFQLSHFVYQSSHRLKPPTPIAPSLQSLDLTVDYLDESLLFLANYTSVVTLGIKLISSTWVASPRHVILPRLQALETGHLALLSNITAPALSTIAFDGALYDASLMPPGIGPLESRGLSYFEDLRLVRFTRCGLFFDDHIFPFLTTLRMTKRLELSRCIGTHILLSKLLAGRASQEMLGADPREQAFLANSGNRQDHNYDGSRLPLPYLTHITVINDSCEHDELISAVVYELLSTRTSLHVECDLEQLRDLPGGRSPADQSNNEEGPLNYFGGRLVIVNAPAEVRLKRHPRHQRRPSG